MISQAAESEWEGMSHHGCDAVAVGPGDLHAGTAHSGIVPHLAGIGGAGHAVGDAPHCCEGTGTARKIPPIERRLAADARGGGWRGRGRRRRSGGGRISGRSGYGGGRSSRSSRSRCCCVHPWHGGVGGRGGVRGYGGVGGCGALDLDSGRAPCHSRRDGRDGHENGLELHDV